MILKKMLAKNGCVRLHSLPGARGYNKNNKNTEKFKIISDKELYRLQCGYCFYCGESMDSDIYNWDSNPNGWTRDHFYPRGIRGSLIDNKVLCHFECNLKKGDRIPTKHERRIFHYLNYMKMTMDEAIKAVNAYEMKKYSVKAVQLEMM